MKKRMLGLVLAAVMLLSLLPTTLIASAVEYITLQYNVSAPACIAAGESAWFQFTPTTGGTYHFYSYDSAAIDPVAVLYDASVSQLATNDDTAGREFLISYELVAGQTYYLMVYDYQRDESGSLYVRVGDPVPTDVSLNKSEMNVFSGTQYTLEATVDSPAVDNALTWTSSNTEVATVDENGVVTFLKGGYAKITVETVNLLKASCDVFVTQVDAVINVGDVQEIVVTSIATQVRYYAFTPTETGFYRLRSFDIVSEPLEYAIDPLGYLFDTEFEQLERSDDADGSNFSLEYRMQAGETYIFRAGIYFEQARGSYKVTLEKMPKATSIELGDDLVMEQGENLVLSATYAPAGCGEETYTFTSSDSAVVDVEDDRLYAVGAGEAVITVTSDDTGLTDSITVTVTGIPTLELDKTYTIADEAGVVRYAFCPTVSGRYTIASTAASDENAVASVTLYDRDSELRYNDTADASFTLTYELLAGEYYYYDVLLRAGGNDCTLDFMLTKADETVLPKAVVNTDYTIDIVNPGDGVYFRFEPTVTGTYKIFSDGGTKEKDPRLFVFDDEWNEVNSNDDRDEDTRDYFLEGYFEAGETYYLKSFIYYDYQIGSYTMRIEPLFEVTASATVSGSVMGVEEDTTVVIRLTEEGLSEPAYEVTVIGNGTYEIENVPAATYEVDVTAEGYNPIHATIVVDADVSMDIEMYPATSDHSVWFYLDAADPEPIFGLDIPEGGTVPQPEDPGRENMAFLGWYVDGVKYDFSAPVTCDLRLAARFVPLGDMNFDGNLNTMDALLLFGCLNGARAMTAEQELVADYTQDGSVNMMDALRLFKTVSGQ